MLFLNGEANGEHGSLVLPRFNVDAPAVGFNDALGDGQAEPRALALGGMERLKERGHGGFGYPGSRVGDAKQGLARAMADFKPKGAAALHGLDGVEHDVPYHLAQLVRVQGKRLQAFVQGNLELDGFEKVAVRLD